MSLVCEHCDSSSFLSYCGGCLEAAYCSEKCADANWRETHAFECIGLKGFGDDIVGLKGSENDLEFRISLGQANRLKTILNLVEDIGPDDYVYLKDINNKTLERIVLFLKNEKSLVVSDLDDESFFELIYASNHLDFEQLTFLLIQTLGLRLLKTKNKNYT